MIEPVENGQNGKPRQDTAVLKKNLCAIEQKASEGAKQNPLPEATLNRFEWGIGHGEDAFTPEHEFVAATKPVALEQA